MPRMWAARVVRAAPLGHARPAREARFTTGVHRTHAVGAKARLPAEVVETARLADRVTTDRPADAGRAIYLAATLGLRRPGWRGARRDARPAIQREPAARVRGTHTVGTEARLPREVVEARGLADLVTAHRIPGSAELIQLTTAHALDVRRRGRCRRGRGNGLRPDDATCRTRIARPAREKRAHGLQQQAGFACHVLAAPRATMHAAVCRSRGELATALLLRGGGARKSHCGGAGDQER